jgi:hypothetical protein
MSAQARASRSPFDHCGKMLPKTGIVFPFRERSEKALGDWHGLCAWPRVGREVLSIPPQHASDDQKKRPQARTRLGPVASTQLNSTQLYSTHTWPGRQRAWGKRPGYFNRRKRQAGRIQCGSRISVGWRCWRNRRTTAAQRLQASAEAPRAR